MDTSVEVELGNEAVHLYLQEVKDTQQEIEFQEDNVVLDEVEQATDFLYKAGLSDLSKLYHEGKEITDGVVNVSVRYRNLTEKQAQTIKSRVRTLNKTLRSRQPRRKQRQDIREVAWNADASSTGTRSRSATPDSLDSDGAINDELISDDDQQISLPPFPIDPGTMLFKGRLKWTSSEPLQNKFGKGDRGAVAHLGSENVILKGYQPLGEYGSLKRRERSGSDPTTDAITAKENHTPNDFVHESINIHNISHSHDSLLMASSSTDPMYLMTNEGISFEGLLRQSEHIHPEDKAIEFENANSICIDKLTDSQYQYLQPLLWVEVTSIFDQYKIPVLKRKSSTKKKRANVFGVNLSTLIMRDMPTPIDTSMVPQIFKSIIHQLNTRCLNEDGILRVAGQQQKLNLLCNEIEAKFYNSRKYIEDVLNQTSVHDLTGVLKKLLRDLPDTIFTMELFDMFYKCSMIPLRDDQFKALNLLVLLLPVEHRNTFHLVLQFFKNVIAHQEQNRMTLHNVAMITAPSFFSPKLLLPASKNNLNLKSMSKEELTKHINSAAVCCCIMEQLLNSGDDLWLVPLDLAQQAKEAQKKAQDRSNHGKEKKLRNVKKKLQRSNTQYEPGNLIGPRFRKSDIYI